MTPGSILLALAIFLACASSSWSAPRAVLLPPIPVPKLPAATTAPDVADSYVRMRVSASFAPVRSALEHAIAKELAPGSREELAPMGEEENDPGEGRRLETDVRYRAHVWRDAVGFTAAHDSLWVRIPVNYTIAAHGDGFAPVSCGTERAPERGEFGCLTRIGWNDDWSIEALSSVLPTRYDRRCKPVPPGVNFTALVAHRVQDAAGNRLPELVDSLFGAWRGGREMIATGWQALVQPMRTSLTGIQLDWDPQEARAAPLSAAGDSIVFDVSFRVRPRLVLGAVVEAAAKRNRPLPAPKVRIARDELEIPFDFEIPCDTLAQQVLAACDQAGESVRVSAATVEAGGDRVLVSLALNGAVEGKVPFTGRLRYDPTNFRLEVPDLAPTPEAEKALRSLGDDRARPIRTLGQRALAALRIDLKDDVAMWASSLGKTMQRPVGEDLYLQGGMNRRDVAGVYGGNEVIGVRLVAGGRCHLVRNY